jgi:hypothetical protein
MGSLLGFFEVLLSRRKSRAEIDAFFYFSILRPGAFAGLLPSSKLRADGSKEAISEKDFGWRRCRCSSALHTLISGSA